MATYEDYASRVNPRSLLDQQLDEMNGGVEKHLTNIAVELVDMNTLTPALGLKPNRLRDIQDSRSTPSEQMYAIPKFHTLQIKYLPNFSTVQKAILCVLMAILIWVF